MNPYDVDIKKLKESREIKDEKSLLRLKLANSFLKAISKLSSEEVLSITGLDKSDLSRIKSLSLDRFSIDRMIGLLDALGFSTKINVRPKKVG